MKTYTAQVNSHGNIIVCGDTVPRNSYRIVLTGTYQECLDYKNEPWNHIKQVGKGIYLLTS
jgi:hypothetical protein